MVAFDNRQEHGVDYEDTFAPVVKMTTVQTVLAIAGFQSWPLYQMNVINEFLHGDIKEKVYMHLLPEFPYSSKAEIVRVRCSLHGLKQAPPT